MKKFTKVIAIILSIVFFSSTFSIVVTAQDTSDESYEILYEQNGCRIVEYMMENGDRVIISKEGNLEDEIIITSSGELILNGKSYGMQNTSLSNTSQTRSTLYRYYSSTPFAGTTASEYTTAVSSSLGTSVVFESAIVNLTRASIVAVLMWKLGVTSADDISTLFDAVALVLKSYAVENCPNVTKCHYNLYVTEHSTKSTTLDKLYKNKVDYYYYDEGADNIIASTAYYENWFYN